MPALSTRTAWSRSDRIGASETKPRCRSSHDRNGALRKASPLWSRPSFVRKSGESKDMAKKKKVRVDLRKNRSKPPRPRQWTRDFQDHGFAEEATTGQERVRAKGELSRRRTIIQEETVGANEAGQEPAEMPAVDVSTCLPGRVLRMHGLFSVVETDDGRPFRCAVRRLLKTLATDERNVVAAGDRVWIRPAPNDDGFTQRAEPRHGL